MNKQYNSNDSNNKQVALSEIGMQKVLSRIIELRDSDGSSFIKKKEKIDVVELRQDTERINISKLAKYVGLDDKPLKNIIDKTSGVNYSTIERLIEGLNKGLRGDKIIILNEEDLIRSFSKDDQGEKKHPNRENALPTNTPTGEEMGSAEELVANISPATKTIIDDRLSNGFVGREFVFEAFQNFITKHSHGYFTIVAEPGMGKSTIAAQYVRVRSVDVDCVCFFINYRGDNTEEACITDICRQLRELYGLEDDLQGVSSSKKTGMTLANYLQEISDYKLKNRKLVIVIDALDELEKSNTSSNICLLPSALPKNVYFLLTRRHFEESEEKLFVSSGCQKQNFQMWKKEYMEANNDDIEKYIQIQFNNENLAVKLQNWMDDRHISQTDFIDTLVERSNGNFMYICYVIPAIADGIYRDVSLSELPNTLKGHYRNHVDRMYRIQTSVSVSKTDRKRIVAVFLESRDIKLSLSYIANLLELDVDEVITPITIHFVPFFNPRDLYIRNLSESLKDSHSSELLIEEVENFNLSRTDTENRYQFYHKDFVDFLKKEEIEKEIQAEIYRKIVKRTNSKLTSKLKKSL